MLCMHFSVPVPRDPRWNLFHETLCCLKIKGDAFERSRESLSIAAESKARTARLPWDWCRRPTRLLHTYHEAFVKLFTKDLVGLAPFTDDARPCPASLP